jgi:hypothetical protein
MVMQAVSSGRTPPLLFILITEKRSRVYNLDSLSRKKTVQGPRRTIQAGKRQVRFGAF